MKKNWFDRIVDKFLSWYSVPKNKVFAFRVVLFIANLLLLLGIGIFMWLNFIE